MLSQPAHLLWELFVETWNILSDLDGSVHHWMWHLPEFAAWLCNVYCAEEIWFQKPNAAKVVLMSAFVPNIILPLAISVFQCRMKLWWCNVTWSSPAAAARELLECRNFKAQIIVRCIKISIDLAYLPSTLLKTIHWKSRCHPTTFYWLNSI